MWWNFCGNCWKLSRSVGYLVISSWGLRFPRSVIWWWHRGSCRYVTNRFIFGMGTSMTMNISCIYHDARLVSSWFCMSLECLVSLEIEKLLVLPYYQSFDSRCFLYFIIYLSLFWWLYSAFETFFLNNCLHICLTTGLLTCFLILHCAHVQVLLRVIYNFWLLVRLYL